MILAAALREIGHLRSKTQRQAQEIADLSRSYNLAIRVNHRMADNLATANRERDEARADAELLWGLMSDEDKEAAVTLIRFRDLVDSWEEAS